MKKLLFACWLCLSGCNPEFLDVKRDKSQVVPSTLDDLSGLMADFGTMNLSSGHALGIVGADEYYIDDEVWSLLSDPAQKNAYIWAEDVFEGDESIDWNTSYKRVLYANIVLEGLDRITTAERGNPEYNRIKGEALFHRGLAFFNLSQQFAQPYGSADLGHLGIPLRLESDPNLVSQRASVADTYRQIVQDVGEAAELLPVVASSRFGISKIAAYALMSRIYLQMGEYTAALESADNAISGEATLLDYNGVSPDPTYPFPVYGEGNPEMLLYNSSNNATVFTVSRLKIASDFYALYDDHDLRKKLYFNLDDDGNVRYRGSYRGSYQLFTGIALDEVLLINAECHVRLGQVAEGLDALNDLLDKRFESGFYVPYEDMAQADALALILTERRKELLLRGLRWSDLRRLNSDPATQKVLRRTVFGTDYVLEPQDLRYTLPIPQSAILASGMQQNPR